MKSVAELKEDLSKGLKWDLELRPAFEEMTVARVHERAGRGLYGEDILARTADKRGELILDVGPGSEGVYYHGPDLVTLAEGPQGPYVKFYDNKAFSTQETVRKVGALVENFEGSRDGYLKTWDAIVESPGSTEAEKETFGMAAALVREGKYSLVVTNANGIVTGVSQKLAQEHGVVFEDIAGNNAVDTSVPAFDSSLDKPVTNTTNTPITPQLNPKGRL